ncbi:MAG: gliding motility protein GldL [Bacteroidaceae bacterium]|nr:gliding motility protein GldL [Bacteroidaceae bacterium]
MARNNIIAKLQRWMDSKPGQMFLNYAYSWGASIVILGALFKITHIDGADFMLFLGMGTEVIVFFLAGFERPYDVDNKKEETAKAELAGGEPVIAGGGGGGTVFLGGGMPAGVPVTAEGEVPAEGTISAEGDVPAGGTVGAGGGTVIIGGGGGVPGGGTIIIGGGGGGSLPTGTPGENAEPIDPALLANAAGGAAPAGGSIDPAQLAGAIAASPIVASPQFAGMCPEMQEATQTYVDQLNELTDILKKVAEQSARLTRDSEEMENMNRTLTGINRFYEMQLRSVSAQSASVDEVNEQTKRLASQLEELNQVYARMVEALKVNMTVKGDS